MKKFIPLFIISGVILLTSFLPVLQITILSINGGILYALGDIGVHDSTQIILNSSLTISFLLLFYLSERLLTKLLGVVGVLLFLFPLLVWSAEPLFNTEDYHYSWSFLITGTIIAVVLIATAFMKNRRKATCKLTEPLS